MKGGLYNPRPIDNVPVDNQLQHGVTSNWAYDHGADLDAHTKNVLELIRTGNYFLPTPVITGVSLAIAADKIYAMPFFAVRALTIDRLAIHVTNLSAGDIARLGIYADGTNLYPGALVKDYGTVSVAATGVVATSGDQSLTKGLYWLVLVSDGTPTLYRIKHTWSPLGQDPTSFHAITYSYMNWNKAAVGTGALADPFVAGASLGYQALAVLPRLKTLD